MTLTYKEQLLHPNWQRKRLEVLSAAGWACQTCGCKDNTLHVHHRRYIKGRMVWDYPDDMLAALCKDCHRKEHELKSQLEDELAAQFDEDLSVFVAILLGMRSAVLAEHQPPSADWIDGVMPAGNADEMMRAYHAGIIARRLIQDSDEAFAAKLSWALAQRPDLMEAAVDLAHGHVDSKGAAET